MLSKAFVDDDIDEEDDVEDEGDKVWICNGRRSLR